MTQPFIRRISWFSKKFLENQKSFLRNFNKISTIHEYPWIFLFIDELKKKHKILIILYLKDTGWQDQRSTPGQWGEKWLQLWLGKLFFDGRESVVKILTEERVLVGTWNLFQMASYGATHFNVTTPLTWFLGNLAQNTLNSFCLCLNISSHASFNVLCILVWNPKKIFFSLWLNSCFYDKKNVSLLMVHIK